tara:strand:+ start:761 stop:1297 length:537 start_codon:yes stop_codon:yes gene_type:complete
MDLDWKLNLINELKLSIDENNTTYKQILNTFGMDNIIVTRLLKEFYIDIPTNIYINHHEDVYQADSPYANIDNIMIVNDIDRFITILSLYDTSLTDKTSENYKKFLSLNKDLLLSLKKDKNDEIKGGGATKKNKHIIINDGKNKRYVLVKNNKYQILNETNTEYLLSTKNRGIVRMKK